MTTTLATATLDAVVADRLTAAGRLTPGTALRVVDAGPHTMMTRRLAAEGQWLPKGELMVTHRFDDDTSLLLVLTPEATP